MLMGMPHRPARPDPIDPQPNQLIAPLWHSLLLAAVVLAVSTLGLTSKAHHSLATHHMREYSVTIAWEWLLAAAVLWGVWLRRTPLGSLLGGWRNNIRAWLADIAAACIFWIGSTVILGAVAVLLRLAHIRLPEQTIASLAPTNAAELALFIALSLSAGFCEELLFRGYFQQQVERLAGGRVWVGIAASALLFGCAHFYEGLAGVIAITLFGAMFSLLALERRSLRAGMIGHAWHDALSGIALFVLRQQHMLH
jgi:membrane protease YdiL (CAAX protease family)